MSHGFRSVSFVAAAGLALFAAGCGGSRDAAEEDVASQDNGFSLPGFGGGDAPPADIGVNSFLWRASLETLDFMPLASADPFGGVIVTDWYSAPEEPDERFKATVYILDTRLRADGLNVSIHRQLFDEARGWQDAGVDSSTEIQIENAILTRARQLRIATLEN